MFNDDDDDGNTMALIFCSYLMLIVQFSPPSLTNINEHILQTTDQGVQHENAYANIWSRSLVALAPCLC